MSTGAQSPDPTNLQELAQLEERDFRALTRPMAVYAADPQTRGPHEVAVYHEGRRHIVNIDVEFCDCRDFHFRRKKCQHIRRSEFALGHREVPEAVNEDALDDRLRKRLTDDETTDSEL